jgi:drug/metabolite transporter (DMT)-like permease
LIIIRPASDVFSVNSFIPLLAAFFLGLYQVATKKITKYDAPEVSLFYSSLVGIIVTSIMAFNFWQPIDFNSLYFFVPIGLFFSLGIYFQILALKNARASIIQPFHYTLIFWAIIFGFFFYDDIPDLFTIIGAIIITTSGIFVINQTSKK